MHYPHNTSHNRPDDQPDDTVDQGAVIIPLPTRAAENDVEDQPETDPDHELWWYDQKLSRGRQHRYFGHVIRVGGAEGERLRGELAAVIRDLLEWAATQERCEQDQAGDYQEGKAA